MEPSIKYNTSSLLKRIFGSYISPYRNKIILAAFFMIVAAAASAFYVWLVKPALDGVLVNQKGDLMILIPAAAIVATLVKSVSDYFQDYLIKFVGQSVINDLQLDLYKKLINSDLKFLNKHSSGHFISRFTNDILTLKNSISLMVVSIFRESLTLLFLLGIMFYNDFVLALIGFIVFPVGVYPIVKMGKRIKKVSHSIQEELSKYAVRLDESLRNIKAIKSFCAEQKEIDSARKSLKDLLQCYIKSIKIESFSSPIMETLGGLAVASIIYYGGKQVLAGNTSPGSFFTFIAALFSAYKPMKSLAGLNINLQNGLASAKRIFQVIDEPNFIESQNSKKSLSVKESNIQFEDVRFKYGRKEALKGVSFSIKQNSMVAIVGESGSGKSTLLDLLLKFEDPHSGVIKIDGQDTKDRSPRSVRKNVSIVSQDIMLFNSTIAENIHYGCTGKISKQRIVSAADKAALDFVKDLPKKYDTAIGQFGIELSGGQRQRLAIARAIYKNSKIMIFDEATSSLDQSSEQLIKEAVEKLKSSKTIIFVTHRLSSIQSADQIYVMKKGVVVESGKHKELLDNKGEYYRLYHKKQK